LLWGVELVIYRKTKKRATEQAENVLYHCLANGLSFKVSQGNVINLCPALTATEAEIHKAMDVLENAFEAILRN